MKILIIEDEPSAREILQDLLELNGHIVLAAPDGPAGLQLAAQAPDLIFCDLGLPGLNGYEVITALRQIPACRDTPFIFLSVWTERKDQRLGLALGAADYLSKPFRERDIIAAIAKHGRRPAVGPEPLDMAAIVTAAINRVDTLLQRQSARVFRPDHWPAAVGRTPWVTDLWVELISNAATHGGPQPQITLGGEIPAVGTHARFWVHDTGPGFTESARQRMSVPFTLGGTMRDDGLGLFIVRHLAGKLSGRAGVDHTPGAGARVWFELPKTVPA